MRPERRPGVCVLVAAAALAASAHAEPANPAVSMTVQDFAAKWVMQQGDIAGTGFYAAANAALRASPAKTPRVVLMGDSITYHWAPGQLPGGGAVWINRGIPGQNSSQMLLRFEDDVVALTPAVVVILAGTNDLRVHAGSHADAAPAILGRLRSNVTAMADIASARGIRVVLGGIPPFDAARDGNRRDPETRRAANAWLRTFAKARGYAFADYGGLADAEGRLRTDLSEDGLHPNADAYALMRPILDDAVKAAGIR